MTINEILSKLDDVKESGNGYIARCPAHEDKRQSLSVGTNDKGDKVLVKCFAGCSTDEIVRSLNLDVKDLFASDKAEVKKAEQTEKKKYFYPKLPTSYRREKIVAKYSYTDVMGLPQFVVCRTADKQFPVFTKVEGGWELGRHGSPMLYKLPELVKAINAGKTVFVCEGEKDVLTLLVNDLVGTTSPGGGGTWHKEFNQYFANADVVVLPDNDPTGTLHAKNVVKGLDGIARSIKVLQLPVQKEKEDVTDWFENYGGTKQELMALVESTQPTTASDMPEPEQITIETTLPEEYEPKEEKIVTTSLKADKQKQKAIKANLPKVDKQKKKTIETTLPDANEPTQENDADMSKWSSEEIKDYITAENKVMHKRVAKVLLAKHRIAITKSLKKNRRQMFLYNDGYWQETSSEEIASLFMEWLPEHLATAKLMQAIIDFLPAMQGVLINDNVWNNREDLINLKNCTYDLKNFVAVPHSADFFFTYRLDYAYDAKAYCPLFDESVENYSCGDETWIKAFWEIAGYAMLGTYPIQKMFWFTGNKGRNGKGTCIRIIEELVGENYTVSSIDTRDLREKFYLHRLSGKRLATAGDLHNRLANVALLKQLTGGDRQMTDVKYGEAYAFFSTAKFIFAMNNLPTLPPDENIAPVAKRIFILPFDFVITSPNSELENTIKRTEMSGIFNRAIDGLKRLMSKGEFTSVKRGNDILESYQNKETALDIFLEYFVYDRNTVGMFVHDIYKAYEKYMEMLFGHSWRIDKSVSVTNAYTLLERVKAYLLEQGYEVKSTTRWDGELRRTMRFYPHLRMTTETEAIKSSIERGDGFYTYEDVPQDYPLRNEPTF